MTPDTADAYQHRVGRTGPGSSASWRVDQTVEALTLAQPEDEPIVRQIERLLGVPFQRRRLAEFNYGGFDPEAKPNGDNGQGQGSPASRHRPGAQVHRPTGRSHRPASQPAKGPSNRHGTRQPDRHGRSVAHPRRNTPGRGQRRR